MLNLLLQDAEWDAPFFKRLAPNDTEATTGHQSGIVIPKDLRAYFPSLNPEDTSASAPTTDKRINGELWDGDTCLGGVDTRYQFQTWGGTRTPESRLTDNLGKLRSLASGGDILLIQRHALELTRYRLILVRAGNINDYRQTQEQIGTARWGVLNEKPVTDRLLSEVEAELETSEADEFTLFDPEPATRETRRVQLARTTAFRRQIMALYESLCAVCETGLRASHGLSELEAAHVVPRQRGGRNDARNGLGLCRRHHWAFDKGLFGVDDKRRIHVPEIVLAIPQNRPLAEFAGKQIADPVEPAMRTHGDALSWHFRHILKASQAA